MSAPTPAGGRGIYVEIPMRGPIGEVWRRTQDPALHQQWDLRFSTIQYLPRESESEPQRFLYATRIGFGLKIQGEGESTGERDDVSGRRTSALKFRSADAKSLIEDGSGYWQYIPTADGVRFLTWYDYRARFGAAGRLLDRLIFRPLIGWATAWSFDRLRLWIDEGLPPKASLRAAAIYTTARLTIVFVWLWEGLIPKLIFRDAGERIMLAATGLPVSSLPYIGCAEVAIGCAGLVLWRWRHYFTLNVVAMVVALTTIVVFSPEYITASFNPVTLNAGVVGLAIVGFIVHPLCPCAARCLRQPVRQTE